MLHTVEKNAYAQHDGPTGKDRIPPCQKQTPCTRNACLANLMELSRHDRTGITIKLIVHIIGYQHACLFVELLDRASLVSGLPFCIPECFCDGVHIGVFSDAQAIYATKLLLFIKMLRGFKQRNPSVYAQNQRSSGCKQGS